MGVQLQRCMLYHKNKLTKSLNFMKNSLWIQQGAINIHVYRSITVRGMRREGLLKSVGCKGSVFGSAGCCGRARSTVSSEHTHASRLLKRVAGHAAPRTPQL